MFPPEEIYDANHNHVLTLSGFDGDIFDRQAIGVAERSRMILEIQAMIEQLRKIAWQYHGFPYADQAQAILDRIEGKQEQ